jgi:two-component sensor histidine kinase
MEWLLAIFDESGFMPHGHCFLWYPQLLWLHVGSDALIAAAYFAIPVTLLYFVRRRKDLPFDWMFVMFGVFIVACGAGHVMSIWNVWQPDYWATGVVKGVTALASVGTALLLVRLVPLALALPSPEMLQRKNAELAQEIVKREQAQSALATSLREKEALLQEVHHRVKNNLQVISSLMRIQSKYVQDKLTVDTLRESENRVRSMALVHQKLYQSETLSKIAFEDYLKSLARELFASYGVSRQRVKLEIDVERTSLPVGVAVPLGLIVSELVSNSLKHAFGNTASGSVRIAVERRGDQLELRVSDSGDGLPQGVDPLRSPSMGLQIVSVLSRQIGARYEPPAPGGAEFRFTFVLPADEQLAVADLSA